MTAPGQDSVQDLAAAYALGALSPDEAIRFEAFLATSPEARREVAELRFGVGEHEELAERVADLAERVEVLPDRVLLYTHDGEATIAAVHERGLAPAAVLVRRSTLEDVFLRLTGRTLVD